MTGSQPQRRKSSLTGKSFFQAHAEAEAQASNEAELAKIEADSVPEVSAEPTPLVESPAVTQTAPQQDTPPSETASTAPASVSHSDGASYTAADVQKMAVDAARRFGPEKVKAIIAEYPGATKIADLIPGDLAGFVGKLNALSVE